MIGLGLGSARFTSDWITSIVSYPHCTYSGGRVAQQEAKGLLYSTNQVGRFTSSLSALPAILTTPRDRDGSGNRRSMIINSCSRLSMSFPHCYHITENSRLKQRIVSSEACRCTSLYEKCTLPPHLLSLRYNRDMLRDYCGSINTS